MGWEGFVEGWRVVCEGWWWVVVGGGGWWWREGGLGVVE